MLELAERVHAVAHRMGLDAQVRHVENPRVEKEAHYYSTTNEHLLSLGLQPHLLDDEILEQLIVTAAVNRRRIDPAQIDAEVKWKSEGRWRLRWRRAGVGLPRDRQTADQRAPGALRSAQAVEMSANPRR